MIKVRKLSLFKVVVVYPNVSFERVASNMAFPRSESEKKVKPDKVRLKIKGLGHLMTALFGNLTVHACSAITFRVNLDYNTHFTDES